MDLKPHFNSENFKIELRNMPPFGFGELKKFLKKINLNPAKVKAVNKKGVKGQVAYVCFRSEEEKIVALEKLNGYVWKKKTIEACISEAVIDPMHKHRIENTKPESKNSCLEATAPLVHMPYEEQLKFKEQEIIDLLKSYGHQMQKVNANLKDNIINISDRNNGIPCQWNGIVASPQINGYRNKSEFSVGKNARGEIVVGFRTGSYVEGSLEVCSIDDLPHIPNEMKDAAKVFERFVRKSTLDVFNPETRCGIFRQLTVRFSGATNQMMLIIGLHIQQDDPEFLNLQKNILEYYKDTMETTKLTSLYLQLINKKISGNTTDPFIHIYGDPYITEILCELEFRVSPSAFFQINTKGAEVLYQSAINLVSPTNRTTILDICCGTGSIGICFSKHCAQVLGVEINAEAIEDAKFNASKNNITNCKFFAGNCDDFIDSLLHMAETDDVVAVIDPPRAGLHARSISSLRNAKRLKRFVYVSCSPKDALKNWIDFGRNPSKTYRGDPFVPVAAVAVDMFPHTKHTELVILFERVNLSVE